jgi:hypothetical protein
MERALSAMEGGRPMNEPRHDIKLSNGKIMRVCESCRFLVARVHLECLQKVCSYCATDPCDLCRKGQKEKKPNPLAVLPDLEIVV